MDSTNGGPRHGDGQSSFFNQRGAANDGPKSQVAMNTARNSNGDPEAAKRADEAQRFDDEKRRIIKNCFGKLDEHGVPLQGYITHIQVHEYSSSPSSPPAPDMPAGNQKSRVIIIAVKNDSGRVMMHKARENDDATYQIGKSWHIEELSSIDNFSPSQARSNEEIDRATRAGPLGFTLMMGKPYFWRARSLLEKGHFILGLIKVYTKYTKHLPQLINFEPREKEQIIRSVPVPSPGVHLHREQQPAPLQPQARGGPQQQQQQRHQQISQQSNESLPHTASGPASVRTASPQQGPSPLRQHVNNSGDGTPPLRQRGPSDQFRQPPPLTSQLRVQQSQDFRAQQDPSRMQGPPQEPQIRPTAPLRAQPSRSILAEQQQAPRPTYVEQQGRVLSEPATVAREHPTFVDGRTQRMATKPAQAQSSEPTPLSIATGRLWRPEGQSGTPVNGVTQSSGLSNLLNNLPTQAPLNSTLPADSAQIIPERRRPPMQDSPPMRNEIEQRTTIRAATSEPTQQSSSIIPGARLQGAYVLPAHSRTISSEPSNLPSPDPVVQPNALSIRTLEAPSNANKSTGILATTSSEPTGTDEQPTPSPIEESEQREEQKYRPGLGPMMGKKLDVANKFRKAATAHSAFKPRAGGAGERLLKSKTSPEADAFNKIVATPSVSRSSELIDSEVKSGEVAVEEEKPSSPLVDQHATQAQTPELVENRVQEVTLEVDPEPLDVPEKEPEVLDDSSLQKQSPKTEEIKVKRRSNAYADALAAIQIDPAIMGGREVEYEDILSEFGWEKTLLQSKQIDTLQTSMRREMGRLEAGSWLGHADQKDDRVEFVGKMLDKAIGECDEMERLLTLYSVELGTLNDDIAYIEAQSQGLQVQTANQKLLQNELEKLMSTISIDARQLESLQQSSLEDPNGLADIERSLLLLYQALRKISPSLVGHEDRVSYAGHSDQSLSSMRALQDNKEFYAKETQHFLIRLMKYAEPTFGKAFSKTKEAITRARAEQSLRVDTAVYDLARGALWQYGPLMLFAKEIDARIWQEIMSTYQAQARTVYQDEMRDNVVGWKRLARKATGEEHDALFTSSQEKEVDGLGTAARKLTVKRSQTLAKTLRSEKRLVLDKGQDAKLSPSECFTGALDETTPIVIMEQNFVVDFFHASSTDSSDFVELVTASRPNDRRGTNLTARRPIEADRVMARKVSEIVETVFGSWSNDMQNLLDWATSADPFQGLGILYALEKKQMDLRDGSQEFILRTIRKLQERLVTTFGRFVDGQIRAIEETKVKIKKRRGVISFVKVFPNFSILVENMLPRADGPEGLEVRKLVDGAYENISRAMFESLKTIAKEMPSQIHGGGADPEDKEALNFHILLIENMYHFYTELDERGDEMLGRWRGKAMLEMSEHQELYVSAVIRRPLGKLLDHIGSVESSRSGSATANQSRSAFKKVVGSHDAKEIRRGIDTLRRRIEKHFGEGDDHAISSKLIAQLLGECERRYEDVLDRTQRIAGEVYDGTIEVEFNKADISQGFRR